MRRNRVPTVCALLVGCLLLPACNASGVLTGAAKAPEAAKPSAAPKSIFVADPVPAAEKVKPIPPVKSIPHKVIVVALELMTQPCYCMKDVRRKGLHLVVDFKPPVQANEVFLLQIEPNGNKETAYMGHAFGGPHDLPEIRAKMTPEEVEKLNAKLSKSCCHGMEFIQKGGKRYAQIVEDHEVWSADFTFFKRKGKNGPTLVSLNVDGKALTIPTEK